MLLESAGITLRPINERTRVRLGLSGPVNGTDRVDLFTLEIPSRRPVLGQLRLNLTGVAARAVNQTFGVKAFARGDTFGFGTVRS